MLLTFCSLLLPLWESVIVLCLYVHSSIAIILIGKRAGCFAQFVFLVSHDGCVTLPRGDMGVSAVCCCGIS